MLDLLRAQIAELEADKAELQSRINKDILTMCAMGGQLVKLRGKLKQLETKQTRKQVMK